VKRGTHLLLGVALGSYIGSDVFSSLIAATLSGLSSLIPDLDLHLKHRKSLHNIFAVAVFTIGVALLLVKLGIYEKYIIESIAVGWLSHIFADMLNIQGVYIFYPFSNISFSLKIGRSNSIVLNAIVSLASLVLLSLRIKWLFT